MYCNGTQHSNQMSPSARGGAGCGWSIGGYELQARTETRQQTCFLSLSSNHSYIRRDLLVNTIGFCILTFKTETPLKGMSFTCMPQRGQSTE